MLFGTTIPFDQATLLDLYGTLRHLPAGVPGLGRGGREPGFLMQADADELMAEAALNAPLFGPTS